MQTLTVIAKFFIQLTRQQSEVSKRLSKQQQQQQKTHHGGASGRLFVVVVVWGWGAEFIAVSTQLTELR